MKTKLRWCLLSLLLLLLFCGPSRAAGNSLFNSELPRVTDRAELFSTAEEANLLESIGELREKYETDVAILTVLSLTDPSLGNSRYYSIQDFADDYYDYNGYGCGIRRTGLLLVISMEPGNHAYHFTTTGEEYSSFDSKDVEYVQGQLEALLGDGDYFGAARRFLEMAEYQHLHGRQPMQPGDFLFTFSIAVVVSLCITGSMKRKMNPVRQAREAASYIVQDSYKLRDYNEIFLSRSVTRSAKAESKSGGHTGSSGTSHGGGGGRF